MSGTAADVIAVARGEVGYHEGRSASGGWNNFQKFSPAVPGLEWSQNQAWCQTFQSWVFQQAGAKSLAPVTASCYSAVTWFRDRSRFSQYPGVGAQVFFGPGGGSHVGLVYAYDASYVYTVEGNTNATGGAEGDGVYFKKRLRRDSYVYGYGYPAYPGGIVSADPNWRNPSTPSPSPTPPPFVPIPSPALEADVSVFAEQKPGVTDLASNVSVAVGPGRWRASVVSNLVPRGEKIRLRLDITNPNSTAREGHENVIWDLVNCQYGDRVFDGPAAVHSQRLTHPDAQVSLTVTREA